MKTTSKLLRAVGAESWWRLALGALGWLIVLSALYLLCAGFAGVAGWAP
jgi:hypothetical protein